MIQYLKSLFKGKPAPNPYYPHDELDFSKGPGSTEWKTQCFCVNCQSSLLGRIDVCQGCGAINPHGDDIDLRAVRTIWNGDEWVHQYRYKDGKHQVQRVPHRETVGKPIVDYW